MGLRAEVAEKFEKSTAVRTGKALLPPTSPFNLDGNHHQCPPPTAFHMAGNHQFATGLGFF